MVSPPGGPSDLRQATDDDADREERRSRRWSNDLPTRRISTTTASIAAADACAAIWSRTAERNTS